MKAEMKSHIRGAFGLLLIVVLFLATLYILGTHVHAQGGGQAGTLPAGAQLSNANTWSSLQTFSAGISTTTETASGQITSTVATGTAPFAVSSTTNVANLNASSLNGATFASPGPIGSTSASSGTFLTMTVPSGAVITNALVQIGGPVGTHVTQGTANSDVGGVLTCAGSVATKTFTTGFTSTPVILLFDETTKGGVNLSAKSASAFSISCTGATDVVDYLVIGNPN